MRLQGKRVLVTSSSRNTGCGIARRFAEEGATVVVNGTNAETTSEAARHIADAAGNVTGARLVVDGGASTQLFPSDVDM